MSRYSLPTLAVLLALTLLTGGCSHQSSSPPATPAPGGAAMGVPNDPNMTPAGQQERLAHRNAAQQMARQRGEAMQRAQQH